MDRHTIEFTTKATVCERVPIVGLRPYGMSLAHLVGGAFALARFDLREKFS
jgi:hypothetical protein